MGRFSKTKCWIMLLVFIVSLVLVITGQRNVGYTGLAMEVVGIIGLITLLFTYNKQYK